MILDPLILEEMFLSEKFFSPFHFEFDYMTIFELPIYEQRSSIFGIILNYPFVINVLWISNKLVGSIHIFFENRFVGSPRILQQSEN